MRVGIKRMGNGTSKIGVCRLCGREGSLSFEHVPPERSFNETPVKEILLEETLKVWTGYDRRKLWDYSGLKGKIKQRGSGGYYLCKECNNKTGGWYMREYGDFVEVFHKIIEEGSPQPGDRITVNIQKFFPLRIFKAIMTMFCDINEGCANDESLRRYLLDKESTEFDMSKYAVHICLATGDYRRIHGCSVVAKTDGRMLVLSEIISYPIGVMLYEKIPEGYDPPGVCINAFATCSYNERYNIELGGIPVIGISSPYPDDYRTKGQISFVLAGKEFEQECT